MSKLPIVDARTMDRILRTLGFTPVRQKGSHAFYRHPDGRTTTVPHHSGRDLAHPLTVKFCVKSKSQQRSSSAV